jgi:hypothetical protein
MRWLISSSIVCGHTLCTQQLVIHLQTRNCKISKLLESGYCSYIYRIRYAIKCRLVHAITRREPNKKPSTILTVSGDGNPSLVVSTFGLDLSSTRVFTVVSVGEVLDA